MSTDEQLLDLQRDAPNTAGCRVIYEETSSGKHADQPELEQCFKALRNGDNLVIWRLERLGRSLSDLVKIVANLERQNIGLESLAEKIETSSAADKLIFHLFTALAKFERSLIRGRTQAGLAAARARGWFGGRQRKLNDESIREIRAILRDPNVGFTDVACCYGVSRTTL